MEIEKEKKEYQEKMGFEYLSEEHAEYIRDLVKKAAIADKNCEIFGASKHKYQLNKVMPEKEVHRFEKEYSVKLPEEYVFFFDKGRKWWSRSLLWNIFSGYTKDL